MTVAQTAIYDSCVLFPFALRDLLVQLAVAGLVRAKWTDEITAEWMGAVLEHRPDIPRERLERTRTLMDAVARERDCRVTGYEDLIPALGLPDPDDRHVPAAAIRARADVIVTSNLKHFPAAVLAPYGVEAQHPDAFLMRLLDADPVAVLESGRECRRRKRKPPQTVDDYLAALERQGLPQLVAGLRKSSDAL